MNHTPHFPSSMSGALLVAATLLAACAVEETPAPEATDSDSVIEIPADLAARIDAIHETPSSPTYTVTQASSTLRTWSG